MNYLRTSDLQDKFRVSRQTIWEWHKRHGFPEPHRLGGVPRWREEEVEKWASEQARQVG